MKHERCFICDRRDSRHPHYYLDYNALEEHFKKDHYICNDRECMEKKFVVFESEMDLQAHRISEHSERAAGRDARLVDISGFDIRQPYQQERRGGGRTGEGRNARGRGRGRDQNADTPIATPNQPLRRDEIAFQRQMAIHSAQSITPRTFGGQLSASTTARNSSHPSTPRENNQPPLSQQLESLNLSDTSNVSPEERARLVRHNSVVERAGNLLGHDAQKMAQFREHISYYRQTKVTAPQLIDAFFTLFADTSSNALGTLVREVADLFEDKAKADSLRKAWQDWRAINEDYPSLPGLSGMHGATTSSSGWATAATTNPAIPNAAPSQKHSNRVLRLKNSTRLAGPAPTTSRPSGWVAAAASSAPSSSAFPSLSSSSASTTRSAPSWTGSAAQRQATSTPRAQASRGPTGGDAFPALPNAPKPTTTIFGYGNGRGVIRDYGSRETGFQWGGSSSSTPGPAATPDEGESGSGGKKGKKNKKQVLVQWG